MEDNQEQNKVTAKNEDDQSNRLQTVVPQGDQTEQKNLDQTKIPFNQDSTPQQDQEARPLQGELSPQPIPQKGTPLHEDKIIASQQAQDTSSLKEVLSSQAEPNEQGASSQQKNNETVTPRKSAILPQKKQQSKGVLSQQGQVKLSQEKTLAQKAETPRQKLKQDCPDVSFFLI